MTETKNFQNQGVKNNDQESNSNQLTMYLAGGVIGAAIGYLATSGNGKMLTEGIDMEKLSSKSSELSEAVMEKSRNILQSVVTTATKMFEKQEDTSKESSSDEGNGNLEGLVGRVEEMLSQLVSEETGQMLGEKKEQLQDRMGNIVEMLSKMVDDKNNQNQNSNQEDHDSKMSSAEQHQNLNNGTNTENQSSPQSNTGNESYSMLNVNEDTHHLLEGLEKDS